MLCLHIHVYIVYWTLLFICMCQKIQWQLTYVCVGWFAFFGAHKPMVREKSVYILQCRSSVPWTVSLLVQNRLRKH